VSTKPSSIRAFSRTPIRGEEIRPLGTCFSITNDGLCLTARHVIEDAITLSTPPRRKTELDPERDGLFGALYISPDADPDHPNNNIGGFLPMFCIWSIDILDLALIKLSLPTNTNTGELLRFTPSLYPSAGQKGYPQRRSKGV
jgi:hypothetical protein